MNALKLITATVEPGTGDLVSGFKDWLRRLPNARTSTRGHQYDVVFEFDRLDTLVGVSTQYGEQAYVYVVFLDATLKSGDLDSKNIRGFKDLILKCLAKLKEIKSAGSQEDAAHKASDFLRTHGMKASWHTAGAEARAAIIWQRAHDPVTATVEPQAEDPERILSRVATQLGWHHDDHDGAAEANVSMYKKVNENTGLRVSADNRDHSGHPQLFVEIHSAELDDFFLEAALTETNCGAGIQAWSRNPSVIRGFLRDLETELRADNPKPLRMAYGHDKYRLDPLTGFNDVIRKAIRSARA